VLAAAAASLSGPFLFLLSGFNFSYLSRPSKRLNFKKAIGAPVLIGSSSTTVFLIKSSGGGIKFAIIGSFIMLYFIANLNCSAISVLDSLCSSIPGLSLSSSKSF
jgi:hypothetical protein